MVVKGKNRLTLTNILVGEVWLCSGQSNMEWPMTSIVGNEEEIEQASNNEIRIFTVPKNVQFAPSGNLAGGEWRVVTPENIADFSAVAYFFGKNLQQQYRFPVGLIGSYWGGTDIETWMSKEAAAGSELLDESLEELALLDIPKYRANQEAKKKDLQKYIHTPTDGLIDGKALWADPAYDDADWDIMPVPGMWETSLLPDVDGIVWFRKTIYLTKEQASADAVLYLGMIDDSDLSWVNGNFIGQTEQKYNALRRYKVPQAYLREGANVITVRVTDTGGGGGIWGDSKFLRFETGADRLELSGDWKFRLSPLMLRINDTRFDPNLYPTLLYNGMVHPLHRYALAGVLWYQGENNVDRAEEYKTLFPALIKDWRKQFSYPELPFLYVQLANFMAEKKNPEESSWAELREAQNTALALPRVGAAITIDIGAADDIHPQNKKEVGNRLYLAARKIAYGDQLVYSGPVYQSKQIKDNKVYLTFSHTGSGLISHNKYGYISGFQIAGKDRKFYWAKAYLEEDKVVVYSDEVAQPLAVRYAWSDNPGTIDLYNQEGLPASPFRTDNWTKPRE
jgi:sialate O-acetylesterase